MRENTLQPVANVGESEAETCVSCHTSLPGARCEHCGCAQRAGDFRIVKLLKQSARGRTYLARAADGTQVALKELVFATVPAVGDIEAFEREAKMLRQLSHPAIPRFVASFQTGEGVHKRLYLAQEYVEGGSLLAELERHRYSESEVVAVTRQVLEVLGYLHGLSPTVLHRDIKPENLVRRADGTVSLVDFGDARDLAGEQTHRSSLVGTFGYMAPEQLGGTVTPASDLYALGATVVHLLARRPPSELLDSDFRLSLPKELNVSARFSAFLGKLLAHKPSERFGSAEEALRALARPEAPVKQPVAAAPADAGLDIATDALKHRIDSEISPTSRSRLVMGGLIAMVMALAAALPVPPQFVFILLFGLLVGGGVVLERQATKRVREQILLWANELARHTGASEATLIHRAHSHFDSVRQRRRWRGRIGWVD